MLRALRLLLLGLLAYVIAVVFLFPAAPVLDRFKPQIQPVVVAGVDGSLFNGSADSVVYPDDLVPVSLQNVTWRFTPRKLLAGAAGAAISFDAYGGSGAGDVAATFAGNLSVTDMQFKGPAKGLEPLLPLPIAQFGGDLDARIDHLLLKQQLLQEMRGKLNWNQAQLAGAINAQLGNVNIDIEPAGENRHRGVIAGSGGEIEFDGTVELAMNGDYRTDIVITPTSSTSPELMNALRTIARPEANGRLRIQQTGNVNRLM